MSDIVSSNADPELFAVPWSLTTGTNSDLPTVPHEAQATLSVGRFFLPWTEFGQRDSVANEMTMAQAIADPMIALLNEADRVAEGSFAQLLESAARVLKSAESHRDLK